MADRALRLQVAHALQHFNTWKAEDKARNDAPAIIEPAAIPAVAAETRGASPPEPRPRSPTWAPAPAWTTALPG